MKNSCIYSFIVTLFICNGLFAQVTDFKLRDYKYRTPGFRLSVLQLNTFGAINSNQLWPIDHTGESVKNFTLAGLMGFQYNFYTDTRQHTSFFTPGIDIGLNNTKINGIRNGSSNFIIKGNYSQWDVWYKKDYFLELSQSENLNVNLYKSNNRSTKIQENGSSLKPGISITGGIGQGRLEYVQDAQMALYILEDLFKKKIIQSKVDAQTALNFARLITDIRNKRIFDYRVKRVYELTRIDSFLKANKLVNESDMNYFTTVNDNWAFAVLGISNQFAMNGEIAPDGFIYQPSRNSGSIRYVRVRAGINNEYYQKKLKDTAMESKTSNSINHPSAALIIGFEKDIPVDLIWQKVFGIRGMISYNKLVQIAEPYPNNPVNDDMEYALTGFYNWGYYPNSRTAVILGTNATVTYFNYKKGRIGGSPPNYAISISNTKGIDISTNAFLSGSYFINYTTRIFGYAYLYMTPYSKMVSNNVDFFFNFTYSHSFY